MRTGATHRRVLIGVDTGGTFTDFVCLDRGRLHCHKRLSTPLNPADAVVAGLRELEVARGRFNGRGATSDSLAQITYGSTVATNAVLERKGARVVLVTTAGFEDLLELGRQTRPVLYALEPRKPPPLVARRCRLGVAERTAFDGRVITALGRDAVEDALAGVRRLGAESVAVCFLHSYANPAHERLLGEALARLGVPCSLSHELISEYREYERLSTTVVNAYVAPIMQWHLSDLDRKVRPASLRVMQSSGGAVSVATASREAVRTLLSGPAGGVMGAVRVARRLGMRRLITFDMGGTSTDVSLVDGQPRQQTEWAIADLPVKVPAIDIHTVGAGGGSLVCLDAGAALKVGPESAGADPGPACYGRGDRPTVTDADVVLGRLVSESFLGGRMQLDTRRARRVMQRLGRQLGGLDAEKAAEGVVRVVNAGMERAIRCISVERGYDPRQYTLVAFGGAAGMHACELAMGLGIARVLVPYQPGLLSAWGAMLADLRRDLVQTVRLVDPRPSDLVRMLRPLERRLRRDFRGEHRDAGRMAMHAFFDVRYEGQSYEITIPMSADYRSAFHAAYRRLYGFADLNRPIEIVNLRAVGVLPGAAPPAPKISFAPSAARPHRLRWQGRWIRARWYERDAVPAGQGVPGPLVITELSATTVVPPGWMACRAKTGDLVLDRTSARARGGDALRPTSRQ